MSTETIANLTLELRRSFRASPERLFEAWTNPDEIRQWFGPEGVRVIDVEIDLRAGGKYLISTAGEGGHIWKNIGEYREVDRPCRLAHTWRWDGDSDWDGVDSIVTVEISKQPGGSELRLIHQRFPSAESLKSLDAYFAWRRTPEGEAFVKQLNQP